MRHLRSGRFREEVTMTDETTSRADAAPAPDANPGLGRGGRMNRQLKLAAVSMQVRDVTCGAR
jgi:hypothetical protein